MMRPAKDWVSPKIEIRGTIDRGKGMFAIEKIISGEPLVIFGGEYKDAFTIIAMHDIEAGEELTADYVLWQADENYISKWECKCGSSLCRRRVTGKDWRLPPRKNVSAEALMC